MDRTLPLDVPHYLRYRILRRYRQQRMNMVRHQAPFQNLTLLASRRWVVERTHSWMNRFRRILARWERLPRTFIAMPRLARGIITWRTTGLMK
ncbi:MAG: transposase [Zoogloeaceae bacterium]|nr:transposase [Zoogloeaceae bacterium]